MENFSLSKWNVIVLETHFIYFELRKKVLLRLVQNTIFCGQNFRNDVFGDVLRFYIVIVDHRVKPTFRLWRNMFEIRIKTFHRVHVIAVHLTCDERYFRKINGRTTLYSELQNVCAWNVEKMHVPSVGGTYAVVKEFRAWQ